jgi:hypothetical protein
VAFAAALFVALVSPSILITLGPVTVFTVVVRGVFSRTLQQLATASFVLVVSAYFTGDVICRPGDEARLQDGDEVRLGSCIARARFGRVSFFVSQSSAAPATAAADVTIILHPARQLRRLFCFAVCQRHVLTRKSFAFHMKLFRMMRQRHLSFFAEALADAPGRGSEWVPARDNPIRESALFRSVPKIFYPIVCSHDFPVLPANDVAQRRGETIL